MRARPTSRMVRRTGPSRGRSAASSRPRSRTSRPPRPAGRRRPGGLLDAGDRHGPPRVGGDLPTRRAARRDWQTVGVTVLLIRHAHAGSRKDWDGDDRLRPLSTKGETPGPRPGPPAEAVGPERILSSPFVRCIQTVQPLADHLGLKVEEVDELAEGMGPPPWRWSGRWPGRTVALCTHGDVIPDVLVTLADEDRLDLGPAPRQAKGSAWVLKARAGSSSRRSTCRPSTDGSPLWRWPRCDGAAAVPR